MSSCYTQINTINMPMHGVCNLVKLLRHHLNLRNIENFRLRSDKNIIELWASFDKLKPDAQIYLFDVGHGKFVPYYT